MLLIITESYKIEIIARDVCPTDEDRFSFGKFGYENRTHSYIDIDID